MRHQRQARRSGSAPTGWLLAASRRERDRESREVSTKRPAVHLLNGTAKRETIASAFEDTPELPLQRAKVYGQAAGRAVSTHNRFVALLPAGDRKRRKKTQSRNSTYHAQNAKMGGGGGADVENDHLDGIYCEDGGRERPEGRPGAAAPRTAETVWMCCARGSEAWY